MNGEVFFANAHKTPTKKEKERNKSSLFLSPFLSLIKNTHHSLGGGYGVEGSMKSPKLSHRKLIAYSVATLLLFFVFLLLLSSWFLGPLPSPAPQHLGRLPSLSEKPSDEEEIHIVFSSDNEDKRAVEQAVESLKSHTSSPVHIHYIGEEPLTYHPDVHFIDLNETIRVHNLTQFLNPNNRTHLNMLNTNYPNFARLALPSILPNVNKVMYFDADTTILCDVSILFHSILNDGIFQSAALAAVPREGLKGFGGHPKVDIAVSFNAGVLGMRLDLWREQHLTEKIREITLSNKHTQAYKLGSQPPLAILFGDNFERLPASWNMPPTHRTLELGGRQERRSMWKGKKGTIPPEEEVCVVHWKGGIKPWKISKEKGRPALFRNFDRVDREERKKNALEKRGLL